MEVSESVSKEAYFGKSKEIKPMYRFIRVPPNITSSYTITSSGSTTPAVIDIPVDTYNHYHSCLQWDMNINVNDTADVKNYLFVKNPSPIQKLEFYSRNGQVKIIDANQVNDFYEITWQSAFSHEEFMTFPRMNHRVTTLDQSQGFFLQPSRCGRVPLGINTVLLPNGKGGVHVHATSVTSINNNTTDATYDNDIVHPDAVHPLTTYGGGSATASGYTYGNMVPYEEYAYTIVSKKSNYQIVTATQTQNGPSVRVSLPLGKLIHSFFAKNKDIHYGDIFSIKITWGATTDVYCINLRANTVANLSVDTTVGDSGVPYPGNGTPGNGTQNVDITNLRFEACQESNPIISNALRSQYYAEGQHIIYDHYSFFRQTAGSATSQSVQIRLAVGDGQRVKYIYWAPYSSTLQTNKRYDHLCVGTAKLAQFYTSLNSVRLQNNDVVLSNGDDFEYMKPLIRGSTLALNEMVYKRNWAWCESFVGNNEPLWEQIKKDSDKMQPEGKSLNVSDFLYSINATMNSGATYQWTLAAVCQKEVVISAKGTIVV